MQVLIPPSPFKPDLLLVMVIVTALLKGPKIGIVAGFFAGTLQDVFLGVLLGILTITKMAIGGMAGLVEGQIFKENYFLPPVIVFVFTLIHGGLTILISENLLFNIHIISFFKREILPEAFFNGLIAFIIYLAFYKLDKVGGSHHE